ncbi:AAA family ATPase [Arcobacter sp. FWKO B]|uniref:AAA family ATPase n=1 Tax=Arcobacter sp. FWKO B TaxID=2593672 RepID=UPI0018A4B2EB|nr:ATP-binding protein [Arcobacter sp. FWKO B]QOG12608.1 ATP-binding protein [Arcobacter sp. FWKO B]
MSSPFPYDRLPTQDEFFGRVAEFEKLSQTVKYSNNLLIYSKRRMGKSSLIKTFFEQNSKEYLTIYVDIFDITSKEDFAHKLLKALANAGKFDLKTTIKNLTSLFKRVRVEPTIDTNTLEYSIKPIIATLSFDEMMEDFFHSLNELSKTNKIIVAIDEFQQIASITDVKLDAMMRTYIQERQNISYVFLGSKRHLLTSLFEYKSPLYELATPMLLEPLDIDAIYEYSKKHLKVSYDIVEYIYDISDGETKMIQNILHLMYLQKEKEISKNMVDDALQEIINSKDGSYKLLFDTLGNNQKIALKIVGIYKKGFFANTILQEYNIKKQTLQSSVDALFAKELIDKEDDRYFIPDRAFELWVERL